MVVALCRVGLESHGGQTRYRTLEPLFTRDIDEFEEGAVTDVQHYGDGMRW
jgi:hypothetical protein